MNEIEKYKNDIQIICDNHNVMTLYAFGSVLSDKFNRNSDIDLLVKFKKFNLKNYFNNYIHLKDSLEKVLKREVDLLEEQTLKNPILISSINESKQLVYG